MPICHKCEIDKPESEFVFNKSKGRLQYHCKQCHSEYTKSHYEKNKEQYKEKVRARKIELREWIDEIKSTLHCERCPQNHPAALDFHHEDPDKKEFSLGSAADRGWSKEKILAEMEKCKILCASCHRIHHWEQQQLKIKSQQ